ncbi:MAG: hypothetical protein V8T45_04225, partial [Oscillospiraceae bacterium]
RVVEMKTWFIACAGAAQGFGDKDTYGKTWLAYAYPPIDRGKWTAKWIKHDGYTECSGCEYWYDSPENEDDGDRPVFCPSCGRAITQPGQSWESD